MSQLNVDTIKNRLGTSGPTVPSLTVTNNVNVTGVITATSFVGNGSQLTGITVNSSQWVSGTTGIHTLSNVSIGTTNVGITSLYVSGSSASNVVAVGTASTITLGFATANNFTFTLNGNYILGNPTGVTTGQSGVVYIIQDTVGNRTIGFGSFWKFSGGVAPSIGIASNSVNVLAYSVRNSTSIPANILVGLAGTDGVI